MQDSVTKNTGEKWSSWSLGKTIALGVFVSLIFSLLRLFAAFESGFEGVYFNVVDTIGFIVLIFISSKHEGGIFLKIMAFILITIVSYGLGLLFAFLGFTTLLGLSRTL